MTTTTLLDPDKLFPQEVGPSVTRSRIPLLVITHSRVEYLSDRYVAVRRDLVDETSLRGVEDAGKDVTGLFPAAPDEQPGPSRAQFRVDHLHSLVHLLGLSICAARAGRPDEHVPHHLYRGGEHVGWIATQDSINSRARLDDLTGIVAVMENPPPYDRWLRDDPVAAWEMLQWARGIAGTAGVAE